MNRPYRLVVTVAVVLLAAWIAGAETAVDEPAPDSSGPQTDLQRILGQPDLTGYRAAAADYRLRFPQDHGAHPDFRHEWWYFTGNLQDAEGRRYGYQFTLFRFALGPPPVEKDAVEDGYLENADHTENSDGSAWRSRQLYMGHVALSVPHQQRFYHRERFSRGALDLAGAQTAPFKLWLYDWQVSGGDHGEPPWRIKVTADEFSLALDLQAGKPRVLQGDQGYSVKGAGGASHYYSYTRLPTRGELRFNGQTVNVRGTSWYDREWGSGALAPEQTGWDWFSLQLDDGHELMWYQMRLAQGGIDAASQGVWVRPDGSWQRLHPADMQLQAVDYWQSTDGRCYPVAWRLAAAELADLKLQPLLPQQWWDGRFRYWEGAVAVSGSHRGQGYLELSGYQPQASCP